MQPEELNHIFPALNDVPRSQMSSKEFQRTLYSWFEEKGLVADLRSYLRVLMINELRHTSMVKVEPRSNSLSKQAYSLIIAEHLLREGCYYTLSIFSTEVPGVANHLPISLFENQQKQHTWRFDQESLVNVLELIGICKDSTESLKVAALYFRGKESLLNCLLNGKNVEIELSQMENGDYLSNLLMVLGVPSKMATSVKTKIEERYLQKIPIEMERTKQVLAERNNQIKVLLDEQLNIKKENKKLKNELKECQKRLKQARLREENLTIKESEIRQKLDEVTRLQRSLEKTIIREKPEICSLKHCTQSCDSLLTNNESLKKEIEHLKFVNQEKNFEIENMTIKISSLTKDLQNSKLNIDFLNMCLLRANQINLPQGEEAPSSTDTSEHITCEIIKQVRSKLHNLERESDALDNKFKQLKLNNFVTK